MPKPLLVAVLALSLLWPAVGRTADVPIEGKVAVTKSGALAKIVSRSDDGFALPAPGSPEDPTVGGAELSFFDTAAPGAGHVVFSLDASGWKGLGKPAGSKGYKYRGADDALDPDPKGTCKSVVLKEKVLKAVCKGDAVELRTPFADTQGVTLSLPASEPSTTFCAELGGTEKKNDAKITKRQDAAAPASCPAPEEKLTGFDPGDVAFLADDSLAGRNNATPGSTTTQNWLIAELKKIGAKGARSGVFGDAAFKQPFTSGTNVIGVLEGGVRADEYVILGAHYDHIGSCRVLEPGDTVCNGATDNAAGVAEVLTLGRALAHVPGLERSIVLAFWDREEDGLLGSAHYVNDPLVPLASTVAYVNFDIQGANLIPSAKSYSFAIGAETGGATLQAIVDAAVASHDLDLRRFSHIFGQGRSDYANFTNAGLPIVFFSDATGPCYHTNDDETSVVDFEKLEQQSRIALDVAIELANTASPPAFVPPNPSLATFEDAQVLNEIVNAGIADLGLFAPAEQADLLAAQSDLNAIVADGAGAFDGNDVVTVLLSALDVLAALETLDCDGFL